MGRLSGKVAIITGGARGMGAATSRLFAAEGAKVAIADVLDDAGAALAAELGDSVRFCRLDVTSEQAWADVVTKVEADLGPVDILVNNAGILLFKALLETSLEDYEKVLKVNLVGEFRRSRVLLSRSMLFNDFVHVIHPVVRLRNQHRLWFESQRGGRLFVQQPRLRWLPA